MVVIGANSEISKAFVEKVLAENEYKFKKIYLLSLDLEDAKMFSNHIKVKYNQDSEALVMDFTKEIDMSYFDNIDLDLVFSAAGFMGKNVEEGLYDDENTKRIAMINYSNHILVINYFAKKFEEKSKGTIIGISSVAGLRGRQSNFIYGSAKAGFLTYLDGLRNYLFHKGVHVITVLPGFMATKMTEGMDLPKPLVASPKTAANIMYKAYKNKRNKIYIVGIWWAIMTVIKMIPEFIFKKMKM